MADVAVREVREATSSSDQEEVLDRLNALVLRLRRSAGRLSHEATTELLHRLPDVRHPLGKVAVWEALEYAPPSPELLSAGIEWLKDLGNEARPQALGTVLKLFVESRDQLIEAYGNEPDEFIQYNIARALAADRPREAWDRLCRLVQRKRRLSLELEELIPDDLAALADASDLPFIEQQDRSRQRTRVWNATAQSLRERLGLLED